MYTTTKVFIWIGAALNFLNVFINIRRDYLIVVFFAILAVAGLAIAVLATMKLSEAEKKSDITAFGVLALLFCGLVGGILMLCLKDEQLPNYKKPDGTKTIEERIAEETAKKEDDKNEL